MLNLLSVQVEHLPGVDLRCIRSIYGIRWMLRIQGGRVLEIESVEIIYEYE